MLVLDLEENPEMFSYQIYFTDRQTWRRRKVGISVAAVFCQLEPLTLVAFVSGSSKCCVVKSDWFLVWLNVGKSLIGESIPFTALLQLWHDSVQRQSMGRVFHDRQ